MATEGYDASLELAENMVRIVKHAPYDVALRR